MPPTNFSHSRERLPAEPPGAVRSTCWLAALLGNRPIVTGSVSENATLAQRVESWIGRLEDVHAATAMQLQFILEEPEEDEAGLVAGCGCRIEPRKNRRCPIPSRDPAAQQPDMEEAVAVAEEVVEPPPLNTPGLYLAAAPAASNPRWVTARSSMPAEIWEEAGPTVLLRPKSPVPGEPISSPPNSRAGRGFFLPAADLLNSAAPIGLSLSTGDANAFIRQWAPLLREAGFGVILPDWAGRSCSRPRSAA